MKPFIPIDPDPDRTERLAREERDWEVLAAEREDIRADRYTREGDRLEGAILAAGLGAVTWATFVALVVSF